MDRKLLTPEWLISKGFTSELIYPGDTYYSLNGCEVILTRDGDFLHSSGYIAYEDEMENILTNS